ncbi:MAG: hypothetical protein U1F43_26755 [Myxococcota bacterium]
MSEERPPPILRGDLFSLLDPEGAGAEPTPIRVAQAAKRLVQRVQAGQRAAGAPVVMQCLEELASLSDSSDPSRAFWALTSIRQRLLALGMARSREFPGRLESERVLVLPQAGVVQVARAMKAGGDKDVWFVATREALPSGRRGDGESFGDSVPELADSACGPILYDQVEVTFRLYRFGARASDIRLVMRVVQEPGAFCDILSASDGQRVALLSRDVIGVFDADGKAELSGRLPLDADIDKGAEVTAMALDGDILALNLRRSRDAAVELALIAVSERKGFPVGVVGDDATGLVLGERAAYIIDGVQLVRMPLFNGSDDDVRVFPLRPWFAEYPWSARTLLGWDGKRVWLSNGQKMVIVDSELEHVRAEIILPEPIIDFAVAKGTVHLVHWEHAVARVRVARYTVAE